MGTTHYRNMAQLLTIEDVRSLSLIGIFEILRNRLNEEKKDD